MKIEGVNDKGASIFDYDRYYSENKEPSLLYR